MLSSRKSWGIAAIANFLCLAAVIPYVHSSQLFIMAGLAGLALVYFFVPYNIAFFESSDRTRTAGRSALLFSIPPIIGVAAPVVAGYLISISVWHLWISSFVSLLLVLWISRHSVAFSLPMNSLKSFSATTRLHPVIFLEGFWEALVITVLPVLSLFYFPKPASYGLYLSYLSIIAAGANLLLGRLSDRIHRRRSILLPISFILLVSTVSLTVGVQSLPMFVLITSVIQFFLPVFWNITTAIFVDSYKTLRQAFPGRELVLATGRLFGILLSYMLYRVNGNTTYIFLALGMSMALFFISVYRLGTVRQRSI